MFGNQTNRKKRKTVLHLVQLNPLLFANKAGFTPTFIIMQTPTEFLKSRLDFAASFPMFEK